ncbi:ecdysteroid 22-kinase family protein [Candidatus Binatia bacterium]|nr:ecdysteroid 22-kinase family protein [Candidatus Binatia bacterium]
MDRGDGEAAAGARVVSPAPASAMPASIEHVDERWIAAILAEAAVLGDARVRRIARRVIGAEKGFLSVTARVAIDYDGPAGDAPRSVVVKIEPPAGQFLDAARRFDAFAREIRFYRELGPGSTLRLPRVLFAHAGDDGSVLVMEDLTDLDAADQLHGMRHEQVVATVRAIARLHAAHWTEDGLPPIDWMPAHDHFFDDGFIEHWPRFVAAYDLRIGREAVRLGERVCARKTWIEERIAARPGTAIHGDLRADNLLFTPGAPDAEPVILDWQLATRTLAAIDIARVMGGSEPAAERAGHQVEVCAAWHEALVENGVRGYPLEAALDDFRLATLYCLFIPVKGLYLVGPDAGTRTARLLDVMAERFYASALEVDAGRLLD